MRKKAESMRKQILRNSSLQAQTFCMTIIFLLLAYYSHASLHIHIITLPDTHMKLNEKCVKKQRGVQA